MRGIVDAIVSVLRSGCPRHMLPDGFPPSGTAWLRFRRLRDGAVLERLNRRLSAMGRERAGREAGPPAAIIDGQGVKTRGGGGPRGHEGAGKIAGRGRHALVDADGRPLLLALGRADLRDRDAAGPPIRRSAPRPSIPPSSASSPTVAIRGRVQGPRARDASPVPVETVRSRPGRIGLAVRPRGRVIERTSARARSQPPPPEGCRDDRPVLHRLLTCHRREHHAGTPRTGLSTSSNGLWVSV
jgi:putative transposase